MVKVFTVTVFIVVIIIQHEGMVLEKGPSGWHHQFLRCLFGLCVLRPQQSLVQFLPQLFNLLGGFVVVSSSIVRSGCTIMLRRQLIRATEIEDVQVGCLRNRDGFFGRLGFFWSNGRYIVDAIMGIR